MQEMITYLSASPMWVIALLCAGGLFLVLEVAKRIVLKYTLKLASAKGSERLADFTNGLRLPLTMALLAVSIKFFELVLLYRNIELTTTLPETIAQILLVIALFLFIDTLIINFIKNYTEKNPNFSGGKGIFQTITHAVVITLGVLMVLSSMGVSITPLIASLGITSLAVALALQPTLENFFSGIQILIDKPIRVGDFIELDSGEQGFVEKIGWRSTWVKMLPNNIVIMPNSVLSKSKIINYYYPEKQLSVPVDLSVHYDSDLDHVEKVTLEVAREILKTHKWGVPEYETFVVFHTFDSSSINFTVMLRAQEYFNRYFIKSEFMKALHKRYREEGITIPYPIRAINYEQEKATSEE